MAGTDHVNLDDLQAGHSNNNLFSDHELNSYNNVFAGNGQSQEPSWNLDPDALAANNNHPAGFAHGWHNPQVHRTNTPQASSFEPGQYYQRQYSNSPTPYTAQAYGSHQPNYNPYQTAVDPALSGASGSPGPYAFGLQGYSSSTTQSGTIAPQALQNGNSYGVPGSSTPTSFDPSQLRSTRGYYPGTAAPQVHAEPLQAERLIPPKGRVSGTFIIVDPASLESATNSKRLHNFVTIGGLPQEFPITKSTIPQYVPRKSRNELKKLAAGDQSLLAKIAKKSLKKHKISATKTTKPRLLSDVARQLSGASSASSPSSDDTESSDDDSEYESSDDEMDEPSPIPPARPQEPLQAVRYDALKAVWRRKKQSLTGDDIRTALKDSWEVFRTIRDRWKNDRTAVEEAEKAKKVSELPLLRQRVTDQREMITMAFKTVAQHGHRDIVWHFGSNQSFLYLAYQYLLDRAKENDFGGELALAILDVLSNCGKITNEALEKTNLNKALLKYTKKGDDKRKAQAQKILDDAVALSKSSAEVAKKDGSVEPKSEVSKLGVKAVPEPVAGVKRPRPVDSTTTQPAKRVLSGSTAATLPVNKAGATVTKRTITGSADKSSAMATANANAKPKGHKVTATPTNIFSSMPAFKKPATATPQAAQSKTPANAAARSSTGTATRQAPAPAVSMVASKSGFSLASTLASIGKEKAPEPVKKQEADRPQETAEQKAKRLRKEERRKLRVSWKPEASLVDIQYFHHDPEEELGHDASMVRDVDNIRSEGEMLKKHMDDDDDEDEDLPREETFLTWTTPSNIDFSVVDEQERKRNYDPFGGGELQPESADRAAREQHAANTLMVFYTHNSDIPPSPREPPDMGTEETGSTKDFGPPPAHLLPPMPVQQWQTPPAQVQQYVQPAATADWYSQLAALTQVPQQQQVSQPEQQQAPAPSSLDAIFAAFKTPAQQAPAPQVQQLANPAFNWQAMFGQQAAAQPTPTPAANGQVDLQALLARFAPQAQTQAQTNPQNWAFQNYATQTEPPAQNDASSGGYENAERKRFRENGPLDDQESQFKKKKGWMPAPPGEKPKYVVQCKFYKEGKCKKGDSCTFRHDDD